MQPHHRGARRRNRRKRLPAPAAAEGGWHIVVEGEQVGPISEADVRARVERGEIRADTYIWKEGFADWLKLSAVPEFADLGPADSGSVNIGDVFASDGAVQPSNGSSDRSGGRRRSGAARPLFGDGGGDADIFAAPAASAPASGGDLFGSAGVHSTASSEPRWPSSGGGGGGASMAGHDGGRVDNLTGQRHENSVLFSLSNLQSLAMPSAKPSSMASLGPSSAPTTEGSGLIDIRAMAASTRARARPMAATHGSDGRRSARVRLVFARGPGAAADAVVAADRRGGSTWSSSACSVWSAVSAFWRGG